MRIFTAFLLSLLVLGAVWQADAQASCSTTLSDALASTADLSSLNTVVQAAGLQSMLDDTALNVTVFAPNNAAMAGLLNVLNDSGLNLSAVTAPGSNRAASIILYHILPSAQSSAQLVNGAVEPTLLSGYNVTIDKNTTTANVTIEGEKSSATVLTPDINVCRSYVHIINAVLLPADLTDIPVYTPAPPGAAPSPPGTVTPPPPPPPPPNSAGARSASSLLMGAAAAALVAVFTAL
ncbi:hypothetical protein R1flu_017051 [Riccia fluitans]|uniref:FAS1 domain-containing protein n=1 Tax=Riccia fluitans TaxID=41844 RepID=A0ABD1YPE7_9MARC